MHTSGVALVVWPGVGHLLVSEGSMGTGHTERTAQVGCAVTFIGLSGFPFLRLGCPDERVEVIFILSESSSGASPCLLVPAAKDCSSRSSVQLCLGALS